ncbi:MAG TPA: hypothetical protein VIJ40_04875 [Acidimicrobiales bacterium]
MTKAGYAELPNLKIMAANGVEYAYREVGEGPVRLVSLMHIRGNLDSWDPALIDALSQTRKVMTFDNIGIGLAHADLYDARGFVGEVAQPLLVQRRASD